MNTPTKEQQEIKRLVNVIRALEVHAQTEINAHKNWSINNHKKYDISMWENVMKVIKEYEQPAAAQMTAQEDDSQYSYFVSYYWNTIKQAGNGCINIGTTKPIDDYGDIRKVIEYLNSTIKDAYGNKAECVVLNYLPLKNPTPAQPTDTQPSIEPSANKGQEPAKGDDVKHWYEIKDLIVSAMKKGASPEDWVNICKGLGYNLTRTTPAQAPPADNEREEQWNEKENALYCWLKEKYVFDLSDASYIAQLLYEIKQLNVSQLQQTIDALQIDNKWLLEARNRLDEMCEELQQQLQEKEAEIEICRNNSECREKEYLIQRDALTHAEKTIKQQQEEIERLRGSLEDIKGMSVNDEKDALEFQAIAAAALQSKPPY